MSNLVKLNIPEIHSLNGYLEAMGDFIIGTNYITWFEASGFESTDSEFSANNLIKAAYPNSQPEKGRFIEVSVEQMVEYVNKSLSLPDSLYGRGGLAAVLEKNVASSFWGHLKACIDSEKAKIVFYEPGFDVGDELYNSILWGFTYLIYDEEQSRCVIIHGGASD